MGGAKSAHFCAHCQPIPEELNPVVGTGRWGSASLRREEDGGVSAEPDKLGVHWPRVAVVVSLLREALSVVGDRGLAGITFVGFKWTGLIGRRDYR